MRDIYDSGVNRNTIRMQNGINICIGNSKPESNKIPMAIAGNKLVFKRRDDRILLLSLSACQNKGFIITAVAKWPMQDVGGCKKSRCSRRPLKSFQRLGVYAKKSIFQPRQARHK